MRLCDLAPELLQYCAYSGDLRARDVLKLVLASDDLRIALIDDEYAKDGLRALCGLATCVKQNLPGAIKRVLSSGSHFEAQDYIAIFLWAARKGHIDLMCWVGNSGRFDVNETYPYIPDQVIDMEMTCVASSLLSHSSYDVEYEGYKMPLYYKRKIYGREIFYHRHAPLSLSLLSYAFICIAHEKADSWRKLREEKIQVFTDHVRALITIDGANICVDKSFMLKESARLGLIELAESLITHETPQEDLDVALVEFCAIDDRNLDMAKFLLDKGADPSFDDSRLLWTCTINKYTEMAMLFLKDPRVDPNGPFRVHPSLSFFSGPEPHTFIIQQYINDPRFDPSQHSQQVLEPIRKYLA